MLNVNEKKPWPNKTSLYTFFSWVLLGVLVAVDQISKWWFQLRDLVIMNQGGVLGIFPSWWWTAILIIIWALLVRFWYGKPWNMSHWGMGFIVVGGLGNLIDRLLFEGSVRDFIYYPFFGFYGNIADIYLAIGVLIVMFCQSFEHEDQAKQKIL